MPCTLTQARQRSIKSISTVSTFPQILFPEEATNRASLEKQQGAARTNCSTQHPAGYEGIHLSEECPQYINSLHGEESCVAVVALHKEVDQVSGPI